MDDTSTFTDPYGYVWSAPTDGNQIDAGATFTVTAPSGESASWSVNQVFADAEEAYNTQGAFGWPTTQEEQAFIDSCNSVQQQLTYMLQVANTVTADAQAVQAWLKYAGEVACALAWIPVVGETIAAVGATIVGIDLAIIEPALNDLVAVAAQAGYADLQLMDLSLAVQQHSTMLSDAQNTLASLGQQSLDGFWNAIANLVHAMA